MENSVAVPQKIEQQFCFCVDTQKNHKQKLRFCTPMFVAALFTSVKRWMQPTYPSRDEWDKQNTALSIQWNMIQP